MSFKYQAKPVVVEAFRLHYRGDTQARPEWYVRATIRGTLHTEGDVLLCGTKQEEVIVNEGDWLIRLDNGEIYPCANEVFQKKYEKIK